MCQLFSRTIGRLSFWMIYFILFLCVVVGCDRKEKSVIKLDWLVWDQKNPRFVRINGVEEEIPIPRSVFVTIGKSFKVLTDGGWEYVDKIVVSEENGLVYTRFIFQREVDLETQMYDKIKTEWRKTEYRESFKGEKHIPLTPSTIPEWRTKVESEILAQELEVDLKAKKIEEEWEKREKALDAIQNDRNRSFKNSDEILKVWLAPQVFDKGKVKKYIKGYIERTVLWALFDSRMELSESRETKAAETPEEFVSKREEKRLRKYIKEQIHEGEAREELTGGEVEKLMKEFIGNWDEKTVEEKVNEYHAIFFGEDIWIERSISSQLRFND